MKQPILYGSLETYALIPQEGVKMCHPDPKIYSTSNCCWDATLSPEGRFYLSLGSENGSGNFAYLNYYDREENAIKTCFYTKDHFLPHFRAMPGSKLHSCIDFLPDGRIICCNHNTDKAPSHPEWLPYAYYSHPWESYPGSNIFIYDPKTGFVDNCGIPAPKESLYGGVYSKKNHAFYAIGFQRGHIYKYDLTSREATDLGKGIEACSHRMHVGPDENIYFTSPTGYISRVNTDTDTLEFTGARVREHYCPTHKTSRYLTSYFNLDADRMLVIAGYSNHMCEYNIRTNELKEYGQLISCGELFKDYGNIYYNFAADLDKDGVLWYSVTPRLKNPEYDRKRAIRAPAYLLRWDWQHGGSQELIGVIGTPGDAINLISDLRIDRKKDILYAASAQGSTPPVISIDLAALRRNAGTPGPEHNDPFYDPIVINPGAVSKAKPYEGASLVNIQEPVSNEKVTHVRIYPQLKDDMENSAVLGLYWIDNSTVRGVCGKDTPKYGFEIRNKQLADVIPLEQMTESLHQEYITRSLPENQDPGVKLPHVAGRQYLAVSSATVSWNKGRMLCGTKDGMLALIDGDDVFSLGLTCPCGPVRSIRTNADQTVAWGTCGYDLDHNHIFRYDDKSGLRDLGIMVWIGGHDGPANPDILSCIAPSPKEDQLAVGGCDRLGTVFILDI